MDPGFHFVFLVSRDTFSNFIYPETKDLCKLFLTLVSGILVFSVTFSEKIADFHKAGPWTRNLLLATWAMLVISFLTAGLSLTFLFTAGVRAKMNDAWWGLLMQLGSGTLVLADLAFSLSLVSLTICAAIAVSEKKGNSVPDSSGQQPVNIETSVSIPPR